MDENQNQDRGAVVPFLPTWIGVARSAADAAVARIICSANTAPRRKTIHFVSPALVPAPINDFVLLPPEGRRLIAAFGDGFCRMIDVETDDVLAEYGQHVDGAGAWAVAVTPDGKLVASVGTTDNTVRVYDVVTSRLLGVFHGRKDEVLKCVCIPDGQTLLAGGNPSILAWDLRTGREQPPFEGHTNSVEALALSKKSGRLLSGSSDRSARLFDVRSRYCLAKFDHRASVWCVALDDTATSVYTGCSDGTARIFDAASGRCLAHYEVSKEAVTCLALSSDERTLLAGARDNDVRVLELSGTGRSVRLSSGHTAKVSGVAALDSAILSSSTDGSIRLARVRGASRVIHTPGVVNEIECVAVAPNNRFLAVGGSVEHDAASMWKLFDLTTGDCVRAFLPSGKAVLALWFTPDSRYLAVGHGDENHGTATLFEVSSGRSVAEYSGHTSLVIDLWINQESSRLVTACRDNVTRIFDLFSGKCLATFVGHEKRVRKARLTRDGSRLLTVSMDQTARLWDVASQRCLRIYTHEKPLLWGLALTPDEKGFYTCSEDKTARLWDVESGECRAVYRGHSDEVSGLCLVPGVDDRLFTAGKDGKVGSFDLRTGKPVVSYSAPLGGFKCITASPDGRRLFAGGTDGILHILDRETLELLGKLFLLKEGFLWTIPGDSKVENPSGCFHTDRPDLLNVVEFEEGGATRQLLAKDDERRRLYLLERDRSDLVMAHVAGGADAVRRAARRENEIKARIAFESGRMFLGLPAPANP